MTPEEQIKYDNAQKRVKKIRGFYNHLIVYVIINIMIVVLNVQNLEKGEVYFQFKNFTTAFFWGIGLVAHGLSVFGPNVFFNKDWEDRKIKEFMEKENKEKENWN